MLHELIDALGQDSDLDLGGPGILIVDPVFFDNCGLLGVLQRHAADSFQVPRLPEATRVMPCLGFFPPDIYSGPASRTWWILCLSMIETNYSIAEKAVPNRPCPRG